MEKIRALEKKDLEEVSDLYHGRKSIEELNWLFSNPGNPEQYNGFVAVDSTNRVIGVIGYVLADYTHGRRSLKGVIPMSWKVIDNYKGFAGVMLFKKVLALGDFGIAISGSDKAKDLYPLFKYKYITGISQYYKVLDLSSMIINYKRKTPLKTFGMIAQLLPSRFKNISIKKNKQQVKLIPLKELPLSEQWLITDDSIFKKQITPEYIDWLINCPVVDTYGFEVIRERENFGPCVLYISEKNNLRTGRIVHLPYLGSDRELWKETIKLCIDFLRKKKCDLVTGLALNGFNKKGYKDCGFIEIKKHSKPLFIKDNKGLLSDNDIHNWFLQYSEGDKAYRNF